MIQLEGECRNPYNLGILCDPYNKGMILDSPILGMYRRIVLVNRDYSDSSFILGFYFLKLATGYMLYIRAYCIVLIVEYKKSNFLTPFMVSKLVFF